MDWSDYEVEGQISLEDFLGQKKPIFKVGADAKVHLIECFGGVGSQAMALERLGIDFTSTLIEFDKYPVASYNKIHGTEFEPKDITQIHAEDLEIDSSRLNILCYSFPCQDVSVAGLGKSLEKGSGTRSGLLWEVERLLNECGSNLPEILLMENVKNLVSKKHKEHFDKWCEYLESKGYSNYWQVLNATDYGVAQNRQRCFMVSIKGYYDYKFPAPIELEKTMEDYLEDEIPTSAYITSDKAQRLIETLILEGKIIGAEQYQNPNGKYRPFDNAVSYPLHSQDFARTGFLDMCPTLSARDYKDPKIVTEVTECQEMK